MRVMYDRFIVPPVSESEPLGDHRPSMEEAIAVAEAAQAQSGNTDAHRPAAVRNPALRNCTLRQ
jgi:hypothetical protein